MTRQDAGHLTGYAILRNHAGNEVRMNCTSAREGEASMMKQGFNWRCQPA